jgi:two-component system OmpR family response regulator
MNDQPREAPVRTVLRRTEADHDDEVYDRSADVQILRLCRKLEADPSIRELIKTERGVGYSFSAPVEVG